jgi:O-antigen/teichoic acid export membrane protein
MIGPQPGVGRNALWMILSRFGAQGMAVLFTILLARQLGSAGFGEYAFIATVIFVANALTTFGTDMLLIREIAAKGDLSRLPSALVVQLVLSGLFIAALWMFSAWIPNQSPETSAALKIYSLALIPLAFFTVFTTALRGVQRMDVYSLLNLIVSVLQVGMLLSPKIDIVRLSVLLLSVQTLAALFAGLFCSRTIHHFWQSWRFPYAYLVSFLKEAAPIAFLTFVMMLYQRLNVGMLSIMLGATATGIYSAAFRAVEASKTVHLAIFASLYPAMASDMSLRAFGKQSSIKWGKRQAEIFPFRWEWLRNLRSLALTYFVLLLAGAALISVLLFVFANPLVSLLYGNEFKASAGVLRILSWTLIPFTINTYLTLSFLASKGERFVGRALTVSLLGLWVLNLWWIPARGPEGGAWAALVAECIQSAFLFAGVRSRVHIQGEAHELS